MGAFCLLNIDNKLSNFIPGHIFQCCLTLKLVKPTNTSHIQIVPHSVLSSTCILVDWCVNVILLSFYNMYSYINSSSSNVTTPPQISFQLDFQIIAQKFDQVMKNISNSGHAKKYYFTLNLKTIKNISQIWRLKLNFSHQRITELYIQRTFIALWLNSFLFKVRNRGKIKLPKPH